MPADHDDSPDHIRQFHRTRRHLPHWQSPGAVHFLTFTLEERYLCDLTESPQARVIIAALQHWHDVRYHLDEYTVMPDHVHVLLRPLKTEQGWTSLSKITGGLKGWTAYRINGLLGRRGTLWQDETFDHVVRGPRDFRQIAHYIWMNPFRAGLVDNPAHWPWWGNGRFCGGLGDGSDSLACASRRRCAAFAVPFGGARLRSRPAVAVPVRRGATLPLPSARPRNRNGRRIWEIAPRSRCAAPDGYGCGNGTTNGTDRLESLSYERLRQRHRQRH